MTTATAEQPKRPVKKSLAKATRVRSERGNYRVANASGVVHANEVMGVKAFLDRLGITRSSFSEMRRRAKELGVTLARKDGKLVKVFGGGTGKGQLRTPHGQWVDARDPKKPVLVVCDRANARLSRFELDGTPIDATESGKVVLFPAHAKTRGDVLMVPDLHARVSLFDKANKPIVHLGDDGSEADTAWRKKVLDGFKVRGQPKDWAAGKFVHPHDAAFDKDGNIFVVEWVSTGRVTLLKKVG